MGGYFSIKLAISRLNLAFIKWIAITLKVWLLNGLHTQGFKPPMFLNPNQDARHL
jgi:hypothetical protein